MSNMHSQEPVKENNHHFIFSVLTRTKRSKKSNKWMSDSQSLCHQLSYCKDTVNVMGTLPEMVTLGCLPQALPKWTVPAHG